MGENNRRILSKAQRLVRKFIQPNPPEIIRSYVEWNDDIWGVWEWAENNNQLEILSALAQPPLWALLNEEGQRLLQLKLSRFAEQAKTEHRWREYAGFVMALAGIENNMNSKLALYEESLEVYTRIGDWANEAVCAFEAGRIYRRLCQFDKARRLYLRSYTLWMKARHRKGIGFSLEDLAYLLEAEGRYVDACRLEYCAKKFLAHSLWALSARDYLNGMSYEHKISADQYETKKTAEKLAKELVLEIFGNSL